MKTSRNAEVNRRAVLALALVAMSCGGEAGPGGPASDRAPSEEAESVGAGPYMGQPAPGTDPAPFAPGIVSTGLHTRDLAMTPEGDEIYFSVQSGPFAAIVGSRRQPDGWTPPEVPDFSADPETMEIEPHISPDGQRFYFVSNRPADGSAIAAGQRGEWNHADIWVMDRNADGWGTPHNLGAPVNSEAPEFFPSTTRDGTIYFTREDPETGRNYIYRARPAAGRFGEPERLPEQVNSANQFNAFVSPDESYLILGVFGRDDSLGGTDYYIVFRHADDTWSAPVNLGPTINRARGAEWSPYVSRDGRYFFFMSTRTSYPNPAPDRLTFRGLQVFHAGPGSGNPTIYWMDAGFIEELRQTSGTSPMP